MVIKIILVKFLILKKLRNLISHFVKLGIQLDKNAFTPLLQRIIEVPWALCLFTI